MRILDIIELCGEGECSVAFLMRSAGPLTYCVKIGESFVDKTDEIKFIKKV